MKLTLPFRIVIAAGFVITCCAGAVHSAVTVSSLREPAYTETPILPATGHYLNLKVLPKNISAKDLQRIMVDEFNEGLGVGCGFCHAEKPGSHSLDYASDAKPEKNIARMMIKMTLGLNKKFFQVHKPAIGDPALAVTCMTCHRGQPHPDANQ